jgi:DNA-binding transcriptional LysR family regulator
MERSDRSPSTPRRLSRLLARAVLRSHPVLVRHTVSICSTISAMKQARLQVDRLLVFMAVAETGGFTAAADRLGTSKKLVSHQIQKLETELGGALFVRSTRRVVLTRAGEELRLSCEPALAELALAVERFGAASVEATGSFRVTTTPEFAVSVLGPVLAEFGRLHPRLRIELITSINQLDLVAERIDVAGARRLAPRLVAAVHEVRGVSTVCRRGSGVSGMRRRAQTTE